MTDISIKSRITAVVAYLTASTVLTLQYRQPFSAIYFLFIGLVILSADKILDKSKFQYRTVTAFTVAVFCHQTFFQIFYKTHGDAEQIQTALATAAFLTGIFALTDKKKLPVSIIAAPLICFTNTKIALCYSLLLFSVSIVKFQLAEKINVPESEKKNKKTVKKSKITVSNRNLLVFSMAISIVCFMACIYFTVKDSYRIVEDYDYFLVHFKNVPFILIASIYLLVRLLKNISSATFGIIAGFTLNLIASVAFYFVYGWTAVSLFCIENMLFLILICLENEKAVDCIKNDFHNHKYIFFASLVCMLM